MCVCVFVWVCVCPFCVCVCVCVWVCVCVCVCVHIFYAITVQLNTIKSIMRIRIRKCSGMGKIFTQQIKHDSLNIRT